MRTTIGLQQVSGLLFICRAALLRALAAVRRPTDRASALSARDRRGSNGHGFAGSVGNGAIRVERSDRQRSRNLRRLTVNPWSDMGRPLPRSPAAHHTLRDRFIAPSGGVRRPRRPRPSRRAMTTPRRRVVAKSMVRRSDRGRGRAHVRGRPRAQPSKVSTRRDGGTRGDVVDASSHRLREDRSASDQIDKVPDLR